MMFTNKELYELFGYYERDRFIQIPHGYSYRCPHSRSADFSLFDSGEIPMNMVMNVTEIPLSLYARSDGSRIGYAGKCSTCAKVYYTSQSY